MTLSGHAKQSGQLRGLFHRIHSKHERCRRIGSPFLAVSSWCLAPRRLLKVRHQIGPVQLVACSIWRPVRAGNTCKTPKGSIQATSKMKSRSRMWSRGSEIENIVAWTGTGRPGPTSPTFGMSAPEHSSRVRDDSFYLRLNKYQFGQTQSEQGGESGQKCSEIQYPCRTVVTTGWM